MSREHPAYKIVSEMEDDVRSVSRIADLLDHLSGSPHPMSPDTLCEVARPLKRVGASLEQRFEAAFDTLAGRS